MLYLCYLDFDDTKKCIESVNYYLSETREEDENISKLDAYYAKKGDVPVGNQKSYKPKKIGNC